MARRRRRRGSFRRHKPDMGWWIGHDILSFSGVDASGEVVGNNLNQVFRFNDIDSDQALIAKDKSDWFVKRVIVDAYPVMARVNELTFPGRLWEFAIGTMDDSKATLLDAAHGSVFDSVTYDNWRRVFRTYSRPVYSTAYNGYTGGPAQVVDGTGPATQLHTVDSPWGPSNVRDDFDVSNAGLVPQTGLYVMSSLSTMNGTIEWEVGDTLTVYCTTRVLLQKRRA